MIRTSPVPDHDWRPSGPPIAHPSGVTYLWAECVKCSKHTSAQIRGIAPDPAASEPG